MIPSEFIVPYTASNIISLVLVFTAFKWPGLTRSLFLLIFLAAGIVNMYTALTTPEDYLNYREYALLGIYRNFIDGFFSQHVQVIVCVIATGQLTIAALLTRRGLPLNMAVIGGVIFFIAIAPLGIGSALPAPLLLAAALIAMKHYFEMKFHTESIDSVPA